MACSFCGLEWKSLSGPFFGYRSFVALGIEPEHRMINLFSLGSTSLSEQYLCVHGMIMQVTHWLNVATLFREGCLTCIPLEVPICVRTTTSQRVLLKRLHMARRKPAKCG
jgi:hypothetical protein